MYCGTFTASGLKVEVADGKLKILQEGKVKKFIQDVEQVTFAAEYAAQTGQKVLYITERAVFELIDGVLTLTEIAPGIDLEKDVIAHMEFRPAISPDLKEMDARIFKDVSWVFQNKKKKLSLAAFFYMHFIVYTLVFTVWQILLPCIIRKFKV